MFRSQLSSSWWARARNDCEMISSISVSTIKILMNEFLLTSSFSHMFCLKITNTEHIYVFASLQKRFIRSIGTSEFKISMDSDLSGRKLHGHVNKSMQFVIKSLRLIIFQVNTMIKQQCQLFMNCLLLRLSALYYYWPLTIWTVTHTSISEISCIELVVIVYDDDDDEAWAIIIIHVRIA